MLRAMSLERKENGKDLRKGGGHKHPNSKVKPGGAVRSGQDVRVLRAAAGVSPAARAACAERVELKMIGRQKGACLKS